MYIETARVFAQSKKHLLVEKVINLFDIAFQNLDKDFVAFA